jgi:hypothetical protein
MWPTFDSSPVHLQHVTESFILHWQRYLTHIYPHQFRHVTNKQYTQQPPSPAANPVLLLTTD